MATVAYSGYASVLLVPAGLLFYLLIKWLSDASALNGSVRFSIEPEAQRNRIECISAGELRLAQVRARLMASSLAVRGLPVGIAGLASAIKATTGKDVAGADVAEAVEGAAGSGNPVGRRRVVALHRGLICTTGKPYMELCASSIYEKAMCRGEPMMRAGSQVSEFLRQNGMAYYGELATRLMHSCVSCCGSLTIYAFREAELDSLEHAKCLSERGSATLLLYELCGLASATLCQ